MSPPEVSTGLPFHVKHSESRIAPQRGYAVIRS